MHSCKIQKIFSIVFFLVVLTICILPAYAQNGTISITYRGAGDYYLGDSIIFDGKNTVGNTTVITITGPGLPHEGVPPYNLTGVRERKHDSFACIGNMDIHLGFHTGCRYQQPVYFTVYVHGLRSQ